MAIHVDEVWKLLLQEKGDPSPPQGPRCGSRHRADPLTTRVVTHGDYKCAICLVFSEYSITELAIDADRFTVQS